MPEKIQRSGNKEETSNKTATTEKSSSPIPSISLPKGGGAIRGIGEKFAANPVTGTGSLSVPIFTSPGRSGFGPQLSLSYDSGSGNEQLGFGWSLSLPCITRKTDKGLPKYQDVIESDVFVLSGAEDLVPVLVEENGKWVKKTIPDREINNVTYRIDIYRPRIEGLFARIERWTGQTGEIHWRSITKDNVITIYGKTDNSRIADPLDTFRVFSWLISESYDDRGNAIFYEYKKEDSANVELSEVHEKNRNDLTRSANRYLKYIRYGNKTPHDIDEDLSQRTNWLFEVVFDYGEHDDSIPTLLEPQKWQTRKDAFSTYRSGFEVRTYRLCKRVLMFHHFPDELGIDDYLVRSTEFNYEENHVASFITKITQSGFNRKTDGTYLKKSLPPLEFEYSKATIQDKISQIDAKSLENLPQGLEGMNYRWVDLDGEGLSGILTEQADGWFYKPNLGEGHFGPLQLLSEKPSFAALNSGRQQLLDLAGDGQIELVEFGGPLSGFYERTQDRHWEMFTKFASLPNINWSDPNLRFLDLTGDGHADILITEDNVFTWYPSLAEQGFGRSERVSIPFDEEKGPKLIFSDGTQSIYMGDMSGGGLTDLVRICNGEVCYWPNLGYGRFGAKVTMDDSPWFDAPDIFDHKRIQLADIDGSGTIDIIYLGQKGVNIYFNQSGNSWSEVQTLTLSPRIDNLTSVTVVDLFGNGTACLVWSSPLPGDSSRPMLYIDLMGGQKPHLLTNSKNNMGAETVVHYAASTKFYLKDQANGRPWITRIPFPVHVVEWVETYDRISQNRFTAHYAYHHGYFDGIEREFRGFGMVDQWDTEEFVALSDSDTLPPATNIDKASHVPRVLTKTWFHTGAYFEGEKISRYFEDEYYREGDKSMGVTGLSKTQLEAMLLDDTLLPIDEDTLQQEKLSPEETFEACRSLKGAILRQEIYALDKTEEEDRPYSVSERNYTIKILQPRGRNKHAVFFTHARETIDFHYERKLFKVAGDELVDPKVPNPNARNAADPRVTHSLTLSVDEYGNVLKSVSIGYGRRFKDPSLTSDDQDKQRETLITLTENNFTDPVIENDAYRAPAPFEARTFEVLKVPLQSVPSGVTALLRFKYLYDLVKDADFSSGIRDIPYEDVKHEQATGTDEYRRLIEHVSTVYRSNDLKKFLNPGKLESLALPGESYKLAFTPGLLSRVYQRNSDNPPVLLPNPSSILMGTGNDKGGYVVRDGKWWIPSGKVYFKDETVSAATELAEAASHFFLPRRFTDPFGYSTIIDYDLTNDLLMVKTEDAAGNVVHAENDYRVLQPRLVTDPNGNRSEVKFDALGMVAGVAFMGKQNESDNKPKGDSLEDFEANLTQAQLNEFMAEPRVSIANPSESQAATIMRELLGKATSRIIYDIDRFRRTGEPPFAATIVRETHYEDLKLGLQSKLQVSFSYSDGFGREIQKKIQAEPGRLVEGGPIVNPRWVGSGWTIFNDKGKPVRQYEPYFSDTHHFEFAKIKGESPILFYDPVERVIATLHPNHTYEKVVFDPWHQKTYDVNDTVAMHPRTDADISGYVAEYFKQEAPLPQDWETWLQKRGVDPSSPPQESPLMDPEIRAAVRTLPHADTPTVAYFDTLGRPFITIAHNKFQRRTNGSFVIIDEKYRTRVVLDIEGNQLEVIDAQDRIVIKYDYDMLGTRIHQSSMEAGERWMLNDVAGKPIRAWDSRGFKRRMTYDKLHRPVELFVTEATGSEFLAEKTEYGESITITNPETTNHRLKTWKVYDGTGIVVSERYDFKGNLLSGKRQLLPRPYHKFQINWALNPLPDETFISSTTYDALNRPIQMIAPHSNKEGININIIQPEYNEANLLECENVWLGRDTEPGVLLDPVTANFQPVTNIDYNEKGQRVLIQYGNGVETRYVYDTKTFRLIHLYTRRDATFNKDCGGDGTYPPPPLVASPEEAQAGKQCGLQNIHYTYDPAGNIIVIHDNAQQTVYYNGQVVKPKSEYRYDAIYRLIEACGREHKGQVNVPQTTWNDIGRVDLAHPHDGQNMRNYSEIYEYDEVGNFLNFNHYARSGDWVRSYDYNKESLIETVKSSNRLSSTTVRGATARYNYDLHGNLTIMPHYAKYDVPDQYNMYWDFKDQLQMVDKGGGCKAYYVYDGAGQRVRKVIEDNGTPIEERIYLGGCEIYHKYGGTPLVRETLHIMDDKQRIAMVDTRTSPTKNTKDPIQLIRYQFGNHLASANLELDPEANIISYEEYYPYGSTSYQAVRKDIEVPLKRYRYTGMERDEETGLNYHGARYYVPWLGRWANVDPVFNPHESPFVGFGNNPILFVDTSGLDIEVTSEEFTATFSRRFLEHTQNILDEGILGEHVTIDELAATGLERLSEEMGERIVIIQPRNDQNQTTAEDAWAATAPLNPYERPTEESPDSHDEAVWALIKNFRSHAASQEREREAASPNTVVLFGQYTLDYDAWNLAREEYRSVSTDGNDHSVLRDAEHFLFRYWLGSLGGETVWIPRGLPINIPADKNPPIPVNEAMMRRHDSIYNPLREFADDYLPISPTTPSMYMWEQLGYELGEISRDPIVLAPFYQILLRAGRSSNVESKKRNKQE